MSATAALVMGGIGLGISAIGTGVGVAGTIANKDKNIQGATSEQNLSATSARDTADRLKSGQGLSETEYNRMIDQGRSTANQIGAQAVEATRDVPISSIAIDKLVRGAFAKQAQVKMQTAQQATALDIRQAREDIRSSVSAEQVAGQRADAIQQAELQKQAFEEKLRVQAIANTSKILGGFANTVTGLSDLIGEGVDTVKANNTPITAVEQAKIDDQDISMSAVRAERLAEIDDNWNLSVEEEMRQKQIYNVGDFL